MEVNLSIMTKDQLKKFIVELDKENKKLKKDLEFVYGWKDQLEKENKKLKETIKDHQLYEEKLEHRIIELEELLHWE